jgi:DNA (cytosine-5)-methyltransferase 1
MTEYTLKAIDLFSGVGGLSLGAARAGIEIAGAVENDLNAVEAHKKNFPTTKHITKDITTVRAKELLEAVDLKRNQRLAIIGGPPCQGFSTMGHRQSDDPRNHLFVRFFEIVRKLKPIFFLAENVPGIMDPQNEELRELGLGLVREDYHVLDPVRVAANEFGLPTTRTRYLFVGYKHNYFSHLTEDSFRGAGVRVLVEEALTGLPPRIFASWREEPQSWRRVEYPDSDTRFWTSIRARVPEMVGDPVAIRRLLEESLVSGFLGTTHSDEVRRRFARVRPGATDRISKARRLELDGYCPTLRAGTGPDRGSHQALRPIHPSADRMITPREAARLQGFPDWFQFSPTKWHSFRQIGNSVCPILAELVMRTILKTRK